MDQCIQNVKRATNKNLSALQSLREDNRLIQQKIKHVKELIDSKNPANPNKNDEASKNFDNSSMRSGGGASIAGSVINEVQKNVNIVGALNTLGSSPGGLST
jgi:hypothetical protein